MRAVRATVAILVLVPGPGPGADPKPGDEGTPEYLTASNLVRQLGHPRFAVRETAARQLVEMGGAAVPALRAGTLSRDEEVRTRCVALIPRARAAEWKRRADAYRADRDGQQKHELPLLADWERLTGPPDAGSRTLFADLIRSEGNFLDAVAADRRKAPALCAARCQALLDRVGWPKQQVRAEAGELLAVLFADAVDPLWLGRPSPGMPADLLRNPGLPDTLAASGTGPAVGRLLARWVNAHAEIDPRPRFEFADLVRRKPFPEAVPTLVELASDTKTRYPHLRMLAIEALGAVGGREAATALADLIADEDVLYHRGPRIGDQALAASLTLHGKRAADFGLVARQTTISRPFGGGYIPATLYEFPTSDARSEALRRWQDEVVGKDVGKK
jgi:hypothetical protein